MYKPAPLLAVVALAMLFLSGCRKSNNTLPSPSRPDIYAVGGVGNRAVYWKNDSAIMLPTRTEVSEATGIAVSGNDV